MPWSFHLNSGHGVEDGQCWRGRRVGLLWSVLEAATHLHAVLPRGGVKIGVQLFNSVDLTFMTSSGPQARPQDFPIAAVSRHSFNLNSYVTDWDVSTKVEATGGVICERAVYGGNRTWAHDSIGYTPFTR